MSTICHILLSTAHGPLSYADIASGGRGVTGSEQSMLYLAQAQAAAGHRVIGYWPTESPGFQTGVEVLDARAAWPRFRRADHADVVISWCTADPLRQLRPEVLKIYSIQINDFMLNGYGYEQYVDVFVAVSQAHRGWLLRAVGNPGPDVSWEILPNGVDLSRFEHSIKRIPRRYVYLSSPDRGLHWLLAMWPEVRFAYPEAELHVFYEIQKWLDGAVILNSEVGLRAKYLVSRADALGTHGVHFHGALPPAELAKELLQADMLLYPCDTIRPTEGFGSAVLEACAAGVIPIITNADALGEVYAESGAIMIPLGTHRDWTDRFLNAVLMFDESADCVEARRQHVKAFASRFEWKQVAAQWDEMISRYRRAS